GGGETSHSRTAAARRVPVRAVRAKSGSGGGSAAAALAHAHAPAAMLRVPPTRPKSGGGRKLLHGGTWMGVHKADGAAPNADEPRAGGNKALGTVKADASAFESETPKRSRSPTAGLTLLPPTSCDEEVSREFEAKAKRLSTTRSHDNTAAASSAQNFFSSSGGDGVGDSGDGGGRGRWRKLHARGGGGSEGAPRLKLSVETAAAASGEDDEVLLSPTCHRAEVGMPTFSCSSPVSRSIGRGIAGRVRDDEMHSSVDSAWSMGSIDEAAARESTNTRLEDRFCRSDPVARMLLCQSDEHASGIGYGVDIATASETDDIGGVGGNGSTSTNGGGSANSGPTFGKSVPTEVKTRQEQQRQGAPSKTRITAPKSPTNQAGSSFRGTDPITTAAAAAAAAGTPKRAASAKDVPEVAASSTA
ncbi:unnamed protein product, partial [Scytosiphon promiscuus]